MRLELWHICCLLIPGLILIHLFAAPFTKVEESFNIQATHDFLTYGLSFRQASARINALYDHVRFPGAVPRTFIGAMILSGISNPLTTLLTLELPQQQILVRGVLGLLNAASIVFYTSGVRQAYGKTTALWFMALQASQFHVFFYASRTLPNTYAFALTTTALRFTLPEPAARMPPRTRLKLALYIMTITTVVFRSEVALLLLGHGVQVLFRSISVQAAASMMRSVIIPPVLTATVAGLILTVSIDSFMWQSPRLIWPEAAAFLSNVLPSAGSQGASAWGTSPWHWYLTSALPRLAPTPLLLALPVFLLIPSVVRQQCLSLLLPAAIYIGLYSFLPHKETRFIFPILPTLNTALALIATYTTNRRSRSLIHKCFTYLLILATLASFLVSHLILLLLSALTYPGGTALEVLHNHGTNLDPPRRDIHVHLTNLALQTGVTRFLEHPVPTTSLIYLPGSTDGSRPPLRSGQTRWWYDKSSNDTGLYLEKGFWQRFDYVVVEDVRTVQGFEGVEWDTVGVVPGLGKLRLVGGRQANKSAGVAELLRRMYRDGVLGRTAIALHDTIKGVLCQGKGTGVSFTGGRWVEWAAEPALVVLKSKPAPAAQS